MVSVVTDAVPLALGDEHSIALVEAHWLSFGKGEARSLKHVHDLLGVGVTVQQVHLSGWELGGEQDGLAGPGVVPVDDVPDYQAFLVGFGHHLRRSVPDVSYLHDPPFFLDYRQTDKQILRSNRPEGILERSRDRSFSP